MTPRWKKRLTEAEARQRIIKLDAPRGFFPSADVLFDLLHAGQRWGARIHREPRVCATAARPRATDLPTDDYLSCAEITAGIAWRAGATLVFERTADGIAVGGDLRA